MTTLVYDRKEVGIGYQSADYMDSCLLIVSYLLLLLNKLQNTGK